MAENDNPGNELVVASDNGIVEAIAALKSGNTSMYSSIKGDDFETRNTILEAVMGSVPISDNLDKPITLQDVIVQKVEMLNEATGAFEPQPRILLIDTEGVAYHAISAVLFRDIQNVITILGEPHTWKRQPVVAVAKEGTGNRKFFTLKIIPASKAK